MTEHRDLSLEELNAHLTRRGHSAGFRAIVRQEIIRRQSGNFFPVISPLPEGDEQTLASQGFPSHHTAQAIIARDKPSLPERHTRPDATRE